MNIKRMQQRYCFAISWRETILLFLACFDHSEKSVQFDVFIFTVYFSTCVNILLLLLLLILLILLILFDCNWITFSCIFWIETLWETVVLFSIQAQVHVKTITNTNLFLFCLEWEKDNIYEYLLHPRNWCFWSIFLVFALRHWASASPIWTWYLQYHT